MPFALWVHSCPTSGETTHLTTPTRCQLCGAKPTFHGWVRGVVESFGHYARRYGLAPYGLHRRLADRLFKDLPLPPCEACRGQGVHDIRQGKGFRVCEVCAGFGYTSLPWDEIGKIRAQVLAVYPDVAAPFPLKVMKVVPRELMDVLSKVDTRAAIYACRALDLQAAIRDLIETHSPEWVLAVGRKSGWTGQGDAVQLLNLVVQGGSVHSCVVDVLGRALLEQLVESAGLPAVLKALRACLPGGPIRAGMSRSDSLKALGEAYGPTRRVHWLTSSGVRPYPEELETLLHGRLTRFEADRLNEVLDRVRSPEEALGLIRAQRR